MYICSLLDMRWHQPYTKSCVLLHSIPLVLDLISHQRAATTVRIQAFCGSVQLWDRYLMQKMEITL